MGGAGWLCKKKKPSKTKDASSGAVIASQFDPLQVNPICIGKNLQLL